MQNQAYPIQPRDAKQVAKLGEIVRLAGFACARNSGNHPQSACLWGNQRDRQENPFVGSFGGDQQEYGMVGNEGEDGKRAFAGEQTFAQLEGSWPIHAAPLAT